MTDEKSILSYLSSNALKIMKSDPTVKDSEVMQAVYDQLMAQGEYELTDAQLDRMVRSAVKFARSKNFTRSRSIFEYMGASA